jgi:transposase
LTTKIHLVCDAGGVPLAAGLSAGHRHDVTRLEPLMEAVRIPRRRPGRPRTRPEVLVADRGYDARHVRRYLRRRGIRAVIPERRAGRGLKECRRLATRYEKYARCYLAMVKLAFIRRCFRKLEFSNTA